ncbi:MAG: hypothetical protein COB15_01275 [Flavobacteriales bacterium]|nr:MAG: hypothetical protein COB15_01275 [Flavobacteriales bacterium]
MKTKLTILILTIGLTTLGFTPKDECSTQAQVMGFNGTKCACCHGWMIEINNKTFFADTIPGFNRNSPYAIQGTPQFDNQAYPMSVRVDYYLLETTCNNRIVVTCVQSIE